MSTFFAVPWIFEKDESQVHRSASLGGSSDPPTIGAAGSKSSVRREFFSPTCQVRVVRFYQSCSSPSSFSSTKSTSATSMSTSALPTLQPGTCQVQWAPLDLNLGPSELSEHRWTSTWDPPSSVSTAGPQPGTFRSQWAPLDLNGQIECQKICQIERQIACQIECQKICQIKCQKIYMPDRMPKDMPDRMPEDMPDRMPDKVPESMPDKVPECLPDRMPEDLPDRMPDRMSEDMPDRMPEGMPDRMSEDLPVTKRINVMVGITRSKVFFYFTMVSNHSNHGHRDLLTRLNQEVEKINLRGPILPQKWHI